MDKKQLLSTSLAKIMANEIKTISEMVRNFEVPEISLKEDGSPVTKLDLALSGYIESLMEKKFPGMTFYSEEKFLDWNFPLLALDPLDGTREYIEGRPEWSMSIGLFQNDQFIGEGWVYNPMTNEIYAEAVRIPFFSKESYLGEVSRSEWKEGLFTNRSKSTFMISPMGSIAYKLGRLAFGQSDFVVSLRPKNIWDVAGGTLLCHRAGMKFYSQGKEVTKVEQLYLPPLIWCHEELFSELSSIYP